VISPLLSAALVSGAVSLQSGISVRTDPRVELFEIVFRLADCGEFKADVAGSPYIERVDAWFEPFKDHAAVRLARELHARESISYNAVPDLAVHVDAVPTLVERMPLVPRPERLDPRWSAASASAFLVEMREFARDTRCEEFFARQQPLYDETAKRLEARITGAGMQEWVRTFFGPLAAGSRFTVIASALNGHHNYGCGVQFPDGHLELSPVVGIWKWDELSLPVFDDEHIFTIVHEFTHNFANPVIDRHEKDLETSGRALFATVETVMRNQAYTGWRIMLYESLVRACVVRYLAEHDGEETARTHAQEDAKRGFRWVGDLAHVLETEYEPDRKRYPDLESFAPRVVAFFGALGEAESKRDARAPRPPPPKDRLPRETGNTD
jgi:hypothetical protein